eukprot:4982142-Alexandrium_andersonii.AAC.1
MCIRDRLLRALIPFVCFEYILKRKLSSNFDNASLGCLDRWVRSWRCPELHAGAWGWWVPDAATRTALAVE